MSNPMKEKLRHWVLGNAHNAHQADIDDQTEILESRLITSLQIMDLILFVEQLTGKSVELSQIKPRSFASIDAIYATFFQE